MLFTKSAPKDYLVIALSEKMARVQQLKPAENGLFQGPSQQIEYANLQGLGDELATFCKLNGLKNLACRWLLSLDFYQTYSVDAPKVSPDEVDQALKWQIKDLLEIPVDQALISHYQPAHPDPQNRQIVAVVVEKAMVEQLIAISEAIGQVMDSVEIDELTVGCSLLPYLGEDKIVGFVGEDRQGLVFNFYQGNELSFSRHKKGRFLPHYKGSSEFVLEDEQTTDLNQISDSEEEEFLLETQRTLDYVISQLYRRPLDKILLQTSAEQNPALAETISQLAETEVTTVAPRVSTAEQAAFQPTLAEAGCAMRDL